MIINNFEKCYGCGIQVHRSSRQRVKPCLCHTCKGTDKRVGSNDVGVLCRQLKKNSKRLTPEELLAEQAAWKAQELKVDYDDKVIR